MASTSCFRCSGSSKVWRDESTIHPRKSLRVCQLPSPFAIFFRDTASLRGSPFRGCARMASMTWKRWRRTERRRSGVPWANCMKSSTYTSVWVTGRAAARFDGGALSSGSLDFSRARVAR